MYVIVIAIAAPLVTMGEETPHVINISILDYQTYSDQAFF